MILAGIQLKGVKRDSCQHLAGMTEEGRQIPELLSHL
jgi:hypothetical protein